MRLIGFNFRKVSAERLSDSNKEIKLNTNIDISEIEEVKSDLLKGPETVLGIKFKYSLNYDPNIAKIELNGNILLALEKKLAEEIILKWKTKKMTEDFKLSLFNLILRKCNVRALQLEDEMNLPFHITMPSLKKPEKEKKE